MKALEILSRRWRGLAVLLALSSSPALAQVHAPCKASQLSVTEDRNESHEVDGGLGHQAMTIALRNRSAPACVLKGVPEITLSDNTNHSLQAKVCSGCEDYLFRRQPVGEVLLEPGGSAYVVLGHPTECRNTVTLALRLSDRRNSLRIGVIGLQSCSFLNVTPYLARPPADGSLPDPHQASQP